MITQRQQEVANKLPPAPQTMLAHVWDLCLKAGVAIDKDDFTFIHRAMTDYLANSGEAKRVMLKILKASIREQDYTRQYYQAGHAGDEEKQLDHRAIVEFSGWIYKGKAYPHSSVDVWNKPDLEACEACAGLFPRIHCVQTVKAVHGGKEHLENLCNKCRMFNDNPRIKDTASSKVCETCVIKTCQHHPNKQRIVRDVEHTPDISLPLSSTRVLSEGPTNPMQRYSAI